MYFKIKRGIFGIVVGGGGREEEKYIFSKKDAEAEAEAEEYNNNDNMGIVGWSRSGYWKARRWEKEIVSSEIGVPLMGMKKTLDFCSIGSSSGSKRKTKKTGWVMHEYRLQLQPHYSYSNNTNTNTNTNLENNKWVLCRIFCNKFNDDHIIQRRLHYSISSTNHQDHLLSITPNALSDDDDSVSSTASSSSTSAATIPNHPFPPF